MLGLFFFFATITIIRCEQMKK